MSKYCPLTDTRAEYPLKLTGESRRQLHALWCQLSDILKNITAS
jgi:hypothetical protein